MESKTAIFKFNEKKEWELEGNFSFTSDTCIIDPITFLPLKKTSFWFSPEMIQDITYFQKDNKSEYIEMIAEQLKQDFIVFLNNYDKVYNKKQVI